MYMYCVLVTSTEPLFNTISCPNSLLGQQIGDLW